MAKSPDAFRTISEVADWLGIQAHVLRFWESKFSQVKPIKRAGGRRYYRPTDMLLLGGIKKLLHDDGLTIKGVQKILREQGMSHVSDLSASLDDDTLAQLDDAPGKVSDAAPASQDEKGVVLNFGAQAEKPEPDAPAPVDTVMEETPAAATEALPEAVDHEPAPIPAAEEDAASETDALQSDVDQAGIDTTPETPDPGALSDDLVAESAPTDEAQTEDHAPIEPFSDEHLADAAAVDATTEDVSADTEHDDEAQHVSPSEKEADITPEPTADTGTETDANESLEQDPAPAAALPAFLRHPLGPAPTARAEETAPAPTSEAPQDMAPLREEPAIAAPKARKIDLPPVLAEADITADPGILAAAYACRSLSASQAGEAAPLLERLAALRDAMSAQRRGNNSSANRH